jgi:hypothetical protein
MPLVDHVHRRITVTLAWTGVPRAGASTALGWLQGALPAPEVGALTSVATRHERTLFFEHRPAGLALGAYALGVKLVTVGGVAGFGDARRRALRAADGIAHVLDSQGARLDEQLALLRELAAWGAEEGIDLRALPTVCCFNKRDLSEALVLPVATLSAALNFRGVPEFATSALLGTGVQAAYEGLLALVLRRLGVARPGPETPATGADAPTELVMPTIVPPRPAVITAPRGVPRVPESIL